MKGGNMRVYKLKPTSEALDNLEANEYKGCGQKAHARNDRDLQ